MSKKDSVTYLLVESLEGTQQYQLQCYLAFALAFLGMLFGVYNMELPIERKGFLAMGFLFLTASSFTLAKVIRDRQEADKLEHLSRSGVIQGSERMIRSLRGTNHWYLLVLAAFIVPVIFLGYGVFIMPVSFESKNYIVMVGLFLISATFNLAKNVRDREDAENWREDLQKQS